MKKIKGYWILAAVCCVTLLAACAEDDDDFDEPEPSTVDTSEWPLTGNMDTLSYRAGDDFYMYCNGNYWKTTDLGDAKIKGYFYTESDEYTNKLLSQTDIPHETQLIELASAVKNKPMTDDEIMAYMAPVLELIDQAATNEDCIKLFARLYKLGYFTLLKVNFKVVDGVYKAVLSPIYDYSGQKESVAKTAFVIPQPTQQQLFDHPELAENYHPLANTRGDGNDVVTLLATELGLSPQDVLVSDKDAALFAAYLTASVEEMKGDMSYMVRMLDQPFMNPDLVAKSHSYLGYYSLGKDFMEWVHYIYIMGRYTSSYVFATRWVTQQMIDDMTEKCEELRSVFRRRIADLDWMSATTKERAIEKLDQMIFNVGYPKNWVREAMVDYSHCQTLIEASRMTRQADANLLLSFLGKDIQTHSFNAMLYSGRANSDLRTGNAYYMPQYNSINIYPAFLLPHFYNPDDHEAIHYGTMTVMAHEITHGFDSTGANYDGLGNYRNWWTVQDKMDFEERYQGLIDCYNRLEMLPWDPDYAGKYCPGEQTLTENIADLGGFEIARQAYIEKCQREGYYGEELDKQERKFYQAFANFWRAKYTTELINYLMFTSKDPHSMLRERINGVVMNTDRWYELYNVQWGDNLYLRPEKRTHIW